MGVGGSGRGQTGPASVWALRIGFLEIPVLMGIFLKNGRFSLNYVSASPTGLAVIYALWRVGMLVSKPKQVEYFGPLDISERVDHPDGRRLYSQVLAPNQFADRFFEHHHRLMKEMAYPDSRVQPDRVRTNLRKAIGETTHTLMAFVETARACHEADGDGQSPLIILSPDAVLANAVPSGWAGANVEFRSSWTRHYSCFMQLGDSLIQFLVTAVRPRRLGNHPGPRIGLESAWGLDKTARYNDLFWWWNSNIPGQRLVYFFDRPGTPASKEALALTDSLGIECAVIDPRAVGDAPHLLWRPSPGLALALRRLWNKVRVARWGLTRGRQGRWAAGRMLSMLRHSETQEDFYREFNIMGVFHFQDSGLDYTSLACDGAGSARFGYHWSNIPWPLNSHGRIHQVYFSWGQSHSDMLKASPHAVDHILLSGCIVEGANHGGTANPEVLGHRRELEAAGAERVLALFDTTLTTEKFYEFFFQRIIDDSRWGLLVKPKLSEYVPWATGRFPKLEEFYEEAASTGRIKTLDSQLSPAEAASGADFSVSIDINSAGVVAALAGHRSIHLDYLRLNESPLKEWATFHQDGPDRIVFNDPDVLWQKLNAYYDGPDADPDLGLASESLLHQIDPFRDGRAGERIGQYVNWYLEALDHGLERDEALEQATSRYSTEWGTDSVVQSPTEVPSESLAGTSASV